MTDIKTSYLSSLQNAIIYIMFMMEILVFFDVRFWLMNG